MDDDERLRSIIRVPPKLREQIVAIATAVDISYDGVCRVAARHYAAQHGIELPDWIPVAASSRGAVRPSSSTPKIWIQYPPSWVPLLERLQHREVLTVPAVIREAARELYNLGFEGDRPDWNDLTKRQQKAARDGWIGEARR